MEVWRRISAGRLSELFGASSLEQDRFIRTLGWRQAAERDLAALSTETRAILDAYVAGVNAWLDANRGNLGLAFVITGANPEPWTVLDTLTWGKVQAWNLGGNMSSEVFRFLADARLGDPSRTDELFATREFGPVIVPRRTSSPRLTSIRSPRRTAGRPGRRPGSPRPAAAHPAPHRQPGRRVARPRLDRRRPAAAGGPRRLGRRPRLGSWDRLERLGRGSGVVVDGRRVARERPAPGHLDAVDLVRQRPPLRDRRRGLPVRRRRRQLPGGPGRRPGSQRPDRVGCDERGRGRPGPGHRDGRPGRPDPLPRPRRRVPPLRDHGPSRSRSPAATRRPSRSGKPSTAPSSTTSTSGWPTAR